MLDLLIEHHAPAIKCFRVGGQQPNGLCVVGNGSIQINSGRTRVAAIVESLRKIGSQPDRLVEIGNGIVDLALSQQHNPPPINRPGILGLEADGLAVALNGATKIAFRKAGIPLRYPLRRRQIVLAGGRGVGYVLGLRAGVPRS